MFVNDWDIRQTFPYSFPSDVIHYANLSETDQMIQQESIKQGENKGDQIKTSKFTWDCQAVTSLRQSEVQTTLMRISIGWGGLISTSSIASGSPGPHATAAAFN